MKRCAAAPVILPGVVGIIGVIIIGVIIIVTKVVFSAMDPSPNPFEGNHHNRQQDEPSDYQGVQVGEERQVPRAVLVLQGNE